MAFIRRNSQKMVTNLADIEIIMDFNANKKSMKRLKRYDVPVHQRQTGQSNFSSCNGRRVKHSQSSDTKRPSSALQGLYERFMASDKSNHAPNKKKFGKFTTIPYDDPLPSQNFVRKTNAINTIRMGASKATGSLAPTPSRYCSFNSIRKADENVLKIVKQYPDYKLVKISNTQGNSQDKKSLIPNRTRDDEYVWNTFRKVSDAKIVNKLSILQNNRRTDNKIPKESKISQAVIPHPNIIDKTGNKIDNTRAQTFRRCAACDDVSRKNAQSSQHVTQNVSNVKPPRPEPKKLHEYTKRRVSERLATKTESEPKMSKHPIYFGISHIMTSSQRVNEWLESITDRTVRMCSGENDVCAENRKEKTKAGEHKKQHRRMDGKQKYYSMGVQVDVGKCLKEFEVANESEVARERRYRTRKKDKSSLTYSDSRTIKFSL